MLKRFLYFIFIALFFFSLNSSSINASSKEERIADYSELRDINYWTFNEYGYKITEQYLKLKQEYEVTWTFSSDILASIRELAQTWYNYLPDNLDNRNYLNNLETALRSWKNSGNNITYLDISQWIEDYLTNSKIEKINWTIETNPSSWNAPLNTTLRAKVIDPSWTVIPDENYVWWIDSDWKKNIIWKWASVNYTFLNEGKFSIFLDVISSHRNKSGFIDVLPFRWRSDIEVKEKVANLLINVNGKDLWNDDTLKFNSDEWAFWLIFDASSSTPTWWSKFIETSWDFGNNVVRKNDWAPKIERVTYATKWEFPVTLKLKTNELQEIERKFTISINNPIASINTSQDSWFIWDRLNFSAKSSAYDKNSVYNWQIVDINNNKTIFERTWNFISYEFKEKGKFNVKLKVTNPSWEIDNDNAIIYINSRPPIAEFTYSIPKSNEPNRVLLDATKSYDEDFSDDWKLQFSWESWWKTIKLENANYNNSLWYYSFPSTWEHTVTLEVSDPDGVKAYKKNRIIINSTLTAEFSASPLVIKREWVITFTAKSNNASYFKWDFGDWTSEGSESNIIKHTYKKSWTFNVKLEVSDKDWNTTIITKKAYVSESEKPFALVDISYENWYDIVYDESACNWKWAYKLDRVWNIKFSWQRSVNVDWENNWLDYSWKIWNSIVSNNPIVVRKFDEIWCIPIKLTIRNQKNQQTSSYETLIEIKNISPEMTALEVNAVDLNSEPVIVNLKALWAKDPDWVILSYTWYYYTNNDEEPQDYRVTLKPETTFALPKISWTYYFVVVLKDNNEEKFNSEQMWTKSSVTITWDNSNTPLVELGVNNSSVSVWDEVTFTSKIKNILWQDLTDKTTYFWDFNWDWFYDKESTWVWTINHKFEEAWTYRVKVKAKYKWFSNVKTVTVDVANNLIPDFEYISINNKFIFIDKSLWKYGDITWDLWDGTIIDWLHNFSHVYTDWKKSYEVSLKISQWSKFRDIKKTVVRNTWNLIKSSNKWLNIFSRPEISENWKILLESSNEKVFMYLWDSKWDNFERFAIDYDINYDSDLNWWKDDDIDNKWENSFVEWTIQEIRLNDQRNQIIRLSLLDSSWKTVEKKDIEIIKEYISENTEIKDLSFSWVTAEEKAKIEKLKEYISKFPQSYRIEWMKYLEKLQSEWFDKTEKTKVILEFEWFIDNPNIPNSNEVIDLLESFILTWEEEQNQKNIAYNALKNLLVDDIKCEFNTSEYDTCKDYLVWTLDTIKNSNDENFRKEEAKIILQAVADNPNMTDVEKENFKEILKILIYNPENLVPETAQTPETQESFIQKVFWILTKIMFVILWLIWLVWLIILIFWLIYKISNKDPDKKFEDFILEKTKIKKNNGEVNQNTTDVLWWLSDNTNLENNSSVEDKLETKIETSWDSLQWASNQEQTSTSWQVEKIPDWLKASFDQNWTEETKTNETQINQEIPSPWVNLEIKEETTNPTETSLDTQTTVVQDTNTETPQEKDITQIDEPEVPDWLKDSLSLENPEEETKTIENIDSQVKDENISESISPAETNQEMPEKASSEEDIEIPDWLKDSLSWDENQESEVKVEKEEEIPQKEIPTPVITEEEKESENKVPEINEVKTDEVIPEIEKIPTKEIEENIPEKKEEIKEVKKFDTPPETKDAKQEKFSYTKSKKSQEKKTTTETKKDEKEVKKETTKKDTKKTTKSKTSRTDKKTQKNWDELWQDGMKVPEWLQDDKK